MPESERPTAFMYARIGAFIGLLEIELDLDLIPFLVAFKRPKEGEQNAVTSKGDAAQVDKQRSMPFIGAFRDKDERRKEEKLIQSYNECRTYAQERALAVFPVVVESFSKVSTVNDPKLRAGLETMPKVELFPAERGAPASYNADLDRMSLNKNMYDRYMQIRHLQGKPRETWSESERKNHDTFDDILAHEFGHVIFSRAVVAQGLTPLEYKRNSREWHSVTEPAEMMARGMEEGIAAVVGRYVAARVNGGAYDNHSVASAILNEFYI